MTTRADFESGFAPADGARIYFESAGVGPAVVFIHAGVSDRRMWDPQFDYFADRFHVVRYDLRGFGKSEMPDLSYSNRADLGKVLQFLGIEKAALVGCSMGRVDRDRFHARTSGASYRSAHGRVGREWMERMVRRGNPPLDRVHEARKGGRNRARSRDGRRAVADGPGRRMRTVVGSGSKSG